MQKGKRDEQYMHEEIRTVGQGGEERDVEARSEVVPVGFQVHTMSENRFLQRGPVRRLLRNFSGDSPWTEVSVQLLKNFKERSPPSSLLKVGTFPQVPNWLKCNLIAHTAATQDVSWDMLSPVVLTLLCYAGGRRPPEYDLNVSGSTFLTVPAWTTTF